MTAPALDPLTADLLRLAAALDDDDDPVATDGNRVRDAALEIETLRRSLAEAEKPKVNVGLCIYCGFTTDIGTEDAAALIVDHHAVCEKNPIRAVERERDEAREDLRSLRSGERVTLEIDTSVAQREGAIRDKLIELGWTPPKNPAPTEHTCESTEKAVGASGAGHISAYAENLKRVAEGIAAWMLHRFGPDTPEGREALTLLNAAKTSVQGTEGAGANPLNAVNASPARSPERPTELNGVGSYPEGFTPTDAKLVKDANQHFAAENERLRQALRFYANGHHFDLEDWDAPDEPNWLCPPLEVEVTDLLPPHLWGPDAPEPTKHKGHFSPPWMVEDGGIAETALRGMPIDWDGEEPPTIEGEEPEHPVSLPSQGGERG